jgi:hypothetical protein
MGKKSTKEVRSAEAANLTKEVPPTDFEVRAITPGDPGGPRPVQPMPTTPTTPTPPAAAEPSDTKADPRSSSTTQQRE